MTAKSKRELRWGETPWDNLSREELLREVQRMYAALISANSVLHLVRRGHEFELFWQHNSEHGRHGSGGKALEECRRILEPLHASCPSEDIYRAYFRYAVDLLFPGLGFGWSVCERGHMLANGDGKPVDGTPCEVCQANDQMGTLRPLTWEDLKPRLEGKP